MQEQVKCKQCGKNIKTIEMMNEDERETFNAHHIWVCDECIEKYKLCRGCLSEGKIIKRDDRPLQGNPPCKYHVQSQMYLLIYKFIKTRIEDLGSEDKSRGQFVIRELVQNADDEEAEMIVLRFQNDAIYVANDGRAFSGEDWMNIGEILGGHKENVKDKSGHFGSGFQTVYAFTNAPEVHSNEISKRMNPIDGKEEDIDEGHQRTSPYIDNPSNKGSLFRFPWRDDKAAIERIGGKVYFKNEQEWPRWNRSQIEKLFDDLVEYVHMVFLCCQHLHCIRLIWAIDNEFKSYQVNKNFNLHSTEHHLKVGVVESGYGKTSSDFTESFHLKNWEWDAGKKQYRYLIGSRSVVDNTGKEMHIVKVEEQYQSYYRLKPEVPSGQTEVKINLVHLLLPLFDCTELMTEEEREHGASPFPLYSVIPLPTRTVNRFVFTGHFFPTQTRKDVAVEGPFGEWYRLLMANLMNLYKELFPRLVEEVTTRESPSDVDQSIILSAIPACDITEWMRPGKALDEVNQTWHKRFGGILEQLLFSNRIVLSLEDHSWTYLEDNYLCEDSQFGVADVLNLRYLHSAVTEHPSFKTFKGPRLDAIGFNDQSLFNEWSAIINEAKAKDAVIKYGSTTNNGVRLDHDGLGTLITYCFRPGHANLLLGLSIIPGVDGILREVIEYPLFDRKYGNIELLMLPSMKVHGDFEEYVRTLEVGRRRMDVKGVLKLLSKIVELDKDKFEPMDNDTHEHFSDIVSKVILDPGFALSPDIKDLNFIPFKLDGKIFVGSPNKNRENKLIGIETSSAHIAEAQLRSSIFSRKNVKVDGITPEVEAKIKIVSMTVNEKLYDEINSKLNLVDLQTNPGDPANFVRHFLSPRHGSLFEDDNLNKFINTEDKDVLERQKRSFQVALKAYYSKGAGEKKEDYISREYMARVPSLYDSAGVWAPAGQFAYEMFPELDFGFKTLHPELKAWEQNTLLALGVRRSPDGVTIAKEVLNLVKKGRPDLVRLSNIFAYVLTTDIEEAETLKEISAKEWVPIDGKLVRPTAVVLPFIDNIDAVGFKSGLLYDPSSGSRDLKDRLEVVLEDKSIKNVDNLGCRWELKLEDLLHAIDQARANHEEPSETLFDLVQDAVTKNRVERPAVGHGYLIKNESGSQWVDSKDILLTDEITIPIIDEMGIRVLARDHPHAKYLKWDGAETELRGDIILTAIADGKLEPTLEIWAALERNKSSYDPAIKARLQESLIFPCGDEMLAPVSIVLTNDEECHPFGMVGNRHFIYTTGHNIPSSTLIGLGAKHVDSLTPEDVCDILAHVDRSKEMSEDEVGNVLRLIQISSGKLDSTTEKVYWPCRFRDLIMMSDISRSFIPDDDDVFMSELRTQNIPIPVMEVNGQRRHELKRSATKCGAKLVSREEGLKLRETVTNRKEYNPIITKGLNNLGSSPIAVAALGDDIKYFSWLNSINAYDVDDIRLIYDLDGSDLILESKTSELTDIDSTLELLVLAGESREFTVKRIIKLLHGQIMNHYNIDGKSLERCKRVITQIVEDIISSSTTPPMDPGEIEQWPHDENGKSRYHEIRSKFSEIYGCCQICQRRTPMDEYNTDTMETIKSLVLNKGGMFPTREPVVYSMGNALFLCPTHSTLLSRGLVRFPGMDADSDPRKMAQDLTKGIEVYKTMDKDKQIPNFSCKVFEGKLKDSQWTDCDMLFRAGHLVEVLENIRSYYQRRLDNEEE